MQQLIIITHTLITAPQFSPCKVYSQKIDPTNQMPAAANQLPAPNQSGTLDTQRVTSTIPKAGSDDGAWVYPSPQMVCHKYFNLIADT